MKLFKPVDQTTFYCFSPLVMLLTFSFEFISAIYVLFTAKFKPSAALIILILISLGTFQLAEYQVCSDKSLVWMRIGFIAITLLPPLGLNLINLIIKKPWYSYIGYGLAALFVETFVISSLSIQTAICGGNYMMTTLAGNSLAHFFASYYYLLLMIGFATVYLFMMSLKKMPSRALETSCLSWIGFGYASFMVPTAIVYLLSPAARAGIPSIMCGFAVFLAIILTFKIYPISRKLGI